MNPQNYRNNNPQITQMSADRKLEKNNLRKSAQSAIRIFTVPKGVLNEP